MSDVFWFGWTVHPWHVKLIISWSARASLYCCRVMLVLHVLCCHLSHTSQVMACCLGRTGWLQSMYCHIHHKWWHVVWVGQAGYNQCTVTYITSDGMLFGSDRLVTINALSHTSQVMACCLGRTGWLQSMYCHIHHKWWHVVWVGQAGYNQCTVTYITSDGMLFGSDRLVTINAKNWHDVAFAVIWPKIRLCVFNVRLT